MDSYAPHGGKESYVPHGGMDSYVPHGGEDSYVPHGGKDSYVPYGGKDSYVPYGGKDSFMSHDGIDSYAMGLTYIDSYAPHAGKDSYAPHAGKDSYAPHAGKDSYAPHAGKDSYAPHAGKDSYAPHAGKDNYAPPHAGKDSYAPPYGGKDNAPPYGGKDNYAPPYAGKDNAPPHGATETSLPHGKEGYVPAGAESYLPSGGNFVSADADGYLPHQKMGYVPAGTESFLPGVEVPPQTPETYIKGHSRSVVVHEERWVAGVRGYAPFEKSSKGGPPAQQAGGKMDSKGPAQPQPVQAYPKKAGVSLPSAKLPSWFRGKGFRGARIIKGGAQQKGPAGAAAPPGSMAAAPPGSMEARWRSHLHATTESSTAPAKNPLDVLNMGIVEDGFGNPLGVDEIERARQAETEREHDAQNQPVLGFAAATLLDPAGPPVAGAPAQRGSVNPAAPRQDQLKIDPYQSSIYINEDKCRNILNRHTNGMLFEDALALPLDEGNNPGGKFGPVFKGRKFGKGADRYLTAADLELRPTAEWNKGGAGGPGGAPGGEQWGGARPEDLEHPFKGERQVIQALEASKKKGKKGNLEFSHVSREGRPVLKGRDGSVVEIQPDGSGVVVEAGSGVVGVGSLVEELRSGWAGGKGGVAEGGKADDAPAGGMSKGGGGGKSRGTTITPSGQMGDAYAREQQLESEGVERESWPRKGEWDSGKYPERPPEGYAHVPGGLVSGKGGKESWKGKGKVVGEAPWHSPESGGAPWKGKGWSSGSPWGEVGDYGAQQGPPYAADAGASQSFGGSGPQVGKSVYAAKGGVLSSQPPHAHGPHGSPPVGPYHGAPAGPGVAPAAVTYVIDAHQQAAQYPLPPQQHAGQQPVSSSPPQHPQYHPQYPTVVPPGSSPPQGPAHQQPQFYDPNLQSNFTTPGGTVFPMMQTGPAPVYNPHQQFVPTGTVVPGNTSGVPPLPPGFHYQIVAPAPPPVHQPQVNHQPVAVGTGDEWSTASVPVTQQHPAPVVPQQHQQPLGVPQQYHLAPPPYDSGAPGSVPQQTQTVILPGTGPASSMTTIIIQQPGASGGQAGSSASQQGGPPQDPRVHVIQQPAHHAGVKKNLKAQHHNPYAKSFDPSGLASPILPGN